MYKYRVKRKFAWIPVKVWRKMSSNLGIWIYVWLEEYWIIERRKEFDKYSDIKWSYYTGDYENIYDARYLVDKLNSMVKKENKL